ncbi:30S ribosomal protein S11 [Candidatus Pacearchaeota archaeon]|nr:30S ribosomal protein S11 [Candidatus Pacearchaeota archaeon]
MAEEEKVVVVAEVEKKVKETPDVVEVKEEAQETEQKKERVAKEDKAGIAYIFSSGNNTIVHITDLSGNTISRVSGGMVTKHSRLKSNPTIAMFVAKRAAERARDLGITELYIRMKAKTGSPGFGPGAHAAVKSLGKEGFRIINILDTTRVARGGPKAKGGKRGRRV